MLLYPNFQEFYASPTMIQKCRERRERQFQAVVFGEFFQVKKGRSTAASNPYFYTKSPHFKNWKKQYDVGQKQSRAAEGLWAASLSSLA